MMAWLCAMNLKAHNICLGTPRKQTETLVSIAVADQVFLKFRAYTLPHTFSNESYYVYFRCSGRRKHCYKPAVFWHNKNKPSNGSRRDSAPGSSEANQPEILSWWNGIKPGILKINSCRFATIIVFLVSKFTISKHVNGKRYKYVIFTKSSSSAFSNYQRTIQRNTIMSYTNITQALYFCYSEMACKIRNSHSGLVKAKGLLQCGTVSLGTQWHSATMQVVCLNVI